MILKPTQIKTLIKSEAKLRNQRRHKARDLIKAICLMYGDGSIKRTWRVHSEWKLTEAEEEEEELMLMFIAL